MMNSTLILFIFEALACSAIFALAYRLIIANTTHFKWMRFYLLCSLVLPLLLPLLPHFEFSMSSGQLAQTLGNAGQVIKLNTSQWLLIMPENVTQSTSEAAGALPIWVTTILLVYGLGALYRAMLLVFRLYGIYQTIRRGQVESCDGYQLVKLKDHTPPFSFLNYLFLGSSCQSLSKDELDQVQMHELTHIRQRHSFDLLLLEITDVIFWFNPFHYYIRRSLKDVHEYLADESVSRSGSGHKNYAQLLLRMVSDRPVRVLSPAFGSQQIGRRIKMLTRRRSGRLQLLRFASVLPLSASLLFLFSCLEEVPETYTETPVAATEHLQIAEDSPLKIGKIIWEGNQVYTDAELNDVLRLSSGDKYTKEIVSSRLNYDPEEKSVSDLYMNNGYLFLSIEPEEVARAGNVIDLKIKIFEGTINRVGKITIKGNEKLASEAILKQTDLKTGELFSRKKLIDAQRKVAEMGYFDPQQVGVNPIPVPDNNTVDLEFTVVEIQN